jgi:hypothetical protein
MTTITDDYWKTRLTETLEPLLGVKDPRPKISAYHDMPFAIFQYPQTAEFEIRKDVALLKTRLEQGHGKRVNVISLAALMERALSSQKPLAMIFEAEREVGLEQTVDTVAALLGREGALDDLIVESVPADADPQRDILFLVRAAPLYPVFRVSPLVERLMGRISIPLVLFYPGVREGEAGLRFMGVHDADYGYRPKIF